MPLGVPPPPFPGNAYADAAADGIVDIGGGGTAAGTGAACKAQGTRGQTPVSKDFGDARYNHWPGRAN